MVHRTRSVGARRHGDRVGVVFEGFISGWCTEASCGVRAHDFPLTELGALPTKLKRQLAKDDKT